jgi:hypothetical protein
MLGLSGKDGSVSLPSASCKIMRSVKSTCCEGAISWQLSQVLFRPLQAWPESQLEA